MSICGLPALTLLPVLARLELGRPLDVNPGEAARGELGDARARLGDLARKAGPAAPDPGESRPCHGY